MCIFVKIRDGIFFDFKNVGILGGGQLGKMLLYTTRKWDIKPAFWILKKMPLQDLLCDYFTKGDLTDFQRYTILEKSRCTDHRNRKGECQST